MSKINSPTSLAEKLVRWQLMHGRHELPWQNTHDAYRIWLSEIMLQQTQVVTVVDYYARFLARFPSVTDLANAHLDEVLALWAGLGYYSRARNLHACAQTVVADFGGEFPRTPELLQTLKGIGASTAAAIAVFAYGYPAPILDGNVKRILSRVYGIDDVPSAQTDKILWQKAHETLIKPEDALKLGLPFETALRAYTQGVMDLGAGLCRKNQPDCAVCPWQDDCVAVKTHRVHEIPAAKVRTAIKTLTFDWYIYRYQNQVWVEQQPERGIWAQLWAFPQNERIQNPRSIEQLAVIKHRLTHRTLEISPHLITLDAPPKISQQGQWLDCSDTDHLSLALPKPATELLRILHNEHQTGLFSSKN
ncbi:MAG: A/G-specific adenine glycosylase [Burkholderiales bacterium]|jgi:A/G-specific adenine glycosylase|nr:A/G-specific adenine glycosylase [Burkholderiales bacterium]